MHARSSAVPLAILAGLIIQGPAFCDDQITPDSTPIHNREHNNLPWQQTVHDLLPLYGHRNWIIIADSAYPAQSRDGIETVVANADQLDVLRRVLAMISASRHVRPIIYIDKELSAVPESDAPGISQYRRNLSGVLGAQVAQPLLHENLIAKLDDAAKTFRVLIIKTNMAIPYTSVFLQLDCAYWSADAESRLREALATSGK